MNQEISQRVDANTLYDEGMAFYRRRRWREAKQCFVRVQDLQPDRRGIDALIRELDIFLQLESVETDIPEVIVPEDIVVETADVAEADPPPIEASPQRSGWALLIVFVASVAIVGGVYLARLGKLPFVGGEQHIQQLFDRGTSLILTQRWDDALGVYVELVGELPDDPEVLHGLAQAKQGLYEQALEDQHNAQVVETLDEKLTLIDGARARLNAIAAIDANYEDVPERIVYLDELANVVRMHDEARDDLESGAYGDAIRKLLDIREFVPTYKPGTVSDELVQAYMLRAQLYLELASKDFGPAPAAKSEAPQHLVSDAMLRNVNRAARDFAEAMDEQSAGVDVHEAQALAEALHAGLERYNDWSWGEAIAVLEPVVRADRGYFDGQAALVLCDSLSHHIQILYQGQEIDQVISYFEVMQELAECDLGSVQPLMSALTPTATPTHTLTPTPTNTPVPTLTPTAMPTATPTWTPTPIPEPTQKPSSGGGGSSSEPKATRKPRN